MERHRCKICSKCFPCGRSLGGHMRSHMRFINSPAMEKEKLEKSSYGLRENPKKTCKLSDFAGEDPTSTTSPLKIKQCKVCGKEFASWKALFGHMRCHSDKTCRRSFGTAEQEEEDEAEKGSWKHRFKLTSAASPISVYEQEQEEVAISLMMLSRDVSGCWSIAAESSDKQSEVMEEVELIKQSDESRDLGFEYSGEETVKQKILTLAQFGKKRQRIDEKGSALNAYEAELGREELKLENRYQCTACNRVFHSYQALGGHRASHKRIRGCCFQDSYAESDEKTEAYVEHLTAAEMEDSHSSPSKKSRIHECSICGKIFSSGQALGGHKRSHLMSNVNAATCDDQTAVVVVTTAVPELLDLNLPAPVDEESSHVNPWWIGESIQHEQNMLNLISN